MDVCRGQLVGKEWLFLHKSMKTNCHAKEQSHRRPTHKTMAIKTRFSDITVIVLITRKYLGHRRLLRGWADMQDRGTSFPHT